MKRHTWCNRCKKWHVQTHRNTHPKPRREPGTVERLATDSAFRERFASEWKEPK